MLPTFKDIPSKRFSQPNPAWGWGWPCCCGTSVAQSVLVVMTCRRINIPGVGTTASGTADDYVSVVGLDGNTGTVLWYYDTGLTSAGTPYIAGKTIIDNSGNVYIAVCGKVGALCSNKLIKLNKNGVWQWEYDAGNSTSGSSVTETSGPNYMVSGIDFDSSGNIVFGRFCNDNVSGFIYAVKVDPSGVLVTNYSTHGTGFGALADGVLLTGGASTTTLGLAIDGSDNVYWVESANKTRLISVDTSGNFRWSFIPTVTVGTVAVNRTQHQIMDLKCDRTNHKLFAGRNATIVSDGSTRYSELTKLLTKFDIGGAGTAVGSEDWSFTPNDFFGGTAGTIDLASGSSNFLFKDLSGGASMGSVIGFDPNVFRVYFPVGILSGVATPRDNLANWASTSSAGSPVIGFESIEGSLVNDRTFGIGSCVDPTSGWVFEILERVRPLTGTAVALHPALRRVDSASGISTWTALAVSDMWPLSVSAASYT